MRLPGKQTGDREYGRCGHRPYSLPRYFNYFVHEAQFFQEIGPGQMKGGVVHFAGLAFGHQGVSLLAVALGQQAAALLEEGILSHLQTPPGSINSFRLKL
jgi:hypothetical protein